MDWENIVKKKRDIEDFRLFLEKLRRDIGVQQDELENIVYDKDIEQEFKLRGIELGEAESIITELRIVRNSMKKVISLIESSYDDF